ncbi:MAG: hypothetical protein IH604_19485 [Burkholderiales bacterium]|nr:hypothetical protein [Burkholderiales bacterium]
MKTLPKVLGALVLVSCGMLASVPAMADYGGHRGHHRGGHGGSVRFGISLGVPFYGPRYYPAPYFAYPAPVYAYPPVVLAPAAPPVYIEQGSAGQAAPAPSQAQGDWYYCSDSQAYYPYVAECPAGWQRVPAQPQSR